MISSCRRHLRSALGYSVSSGVGRTWMERGCVVRAALN